MFYKTLLYIGFLINVIFFSITAKEMELVTKSLHRSRRQLLYPNSTTLQFNIGCGFPTGVKNINMNYVIQANFQLPWNRTQIPIDILHANSGYTGSTRKKRDRYIEDDSNRYQDDTKLYHFYKHIETVLDSFGYKGQICLMHTLCQLAAEPLHSEDEEDILHEIASFILNPKNDALHATESNEAYPYIKAYMDGQNHKDCNVLYKGCSISFINLFSRLHDVP